VKGADGYHDRVYRRSRNDTERTETQRVIPGSTVHMIEAPIRFLHPGTARVDQKILNPERLDSSHSRSSPSNPVARYRWPPKHTSACPGHSYRRIAASTWGMLAQRKTLGYYGVRAGVLPKTTTIAVRFRCTSNMEAPVSVGRLLPIFTGLIPSVVGCFFFSSYHIYTLLPPLPLFLFVHFTPPRTTDRTHGRPVASAESASDPDGWNGSGRGRRDWSTTVRGLSCIAESSVLSISLDC